MLKLGHDITSTRSRKARPFLVEAGLEWTSFKIHLLGGGQHDPATALFGGAGCTVWAQIGALL